MKASAIDADRERPAISLAQILGGVDAGTLVKLDEVGFELRWVDARGIGGSLDLRSKEARADSLYRLATRCAPLLRKRIDTVARDGVTLKGKGARIEILWLFAELIACLVVMPLLAAIDTEHSRIRYVLTMIVGLFAAIRIFIWMRRALLRSADLTLYPAPNPGFAHLCQWQPDIRLDKAKFDISDWERGRAVLTDGIQRIPIPIGERPGAFLLFAALLDACGSPDDRLVE